MGLLDEAIREHLELQRRRGADPTEIARAEREALEPVFPAEQPRGTAPDGDDLDGMPVHDQAHGAAAAHAVEAEHAEHGYVEDGHPEDGHPEDGHAHRGHPVDPSFSTLGQETAELDMEAYMDGVDGAAPANEPVEADGAVSGDGHVAEAPGVIGDEMLDWEEPQAGRRELPSEHELPLEHEPPPDQIPGQERLSLE